MLSSGKSDDDRLIAEVITLILEPREPIQLPFLSSP